jgi:hypothetical protein
LVNKEKLLPTHRDVDAERVPHRRNITLDARGDDPLLA